MSSAYNQDFHAWSQQQVTLLREGRLAEIDREHLIEEIESMGASERRELFNRTRVLLQHLLKWRYQPWARSSSWTGTIDEQRDQLDLLLKQSPSLGRLLPDAVTDAYPKACRRAAHETGLDQASFPHACPFSLEQILDPDYWPE